MSPLCESTENLCAPGDALEEVSLFLALGKPDL